MDTHPAAGLAAPRRLAGAVVFLCRLAAETFNDGLRAYYLAFAAICRFFSAWAFAAGTLGVIWVLCRREFHSEVLVALRNGLDGQ